MNFLLLLWAFDILKNGNLSVRQVRITLATEFILLFLQNMLSGFLSNQTSKTGTLEYCELAICR